MDKSSEALARTKESKIENLTVSLSTPQDVNLHLEHYAQL